MNAKKIENENLPEKLDVSMYETGYQKKKMSKIPVLSLNLKVLPNYHGKSNKSLNNFLLNMYQNNHKGEII